MTTKVLVVGTSGVYRVYEPGHGQMPAYYFACADCGNCSRHLHSLSAAAAAAEIHNHPEDQ